MKITIDHEMTGEQIADQMVTAIEGGSVYWCRGVYLKTPDLCESGPWYADPKLWDKPGWLIKVVEDEPSTDDSNGQWIIGPEAMAKGTVIMAQKYPEHFSDMVKEQGDATTADVWLQCIVFGDIVYG